MREKIRPEKYSKSFGKSAFSDVLSSSDYSRISAAFNNKNFTSRDGEKIFNFLPGKLVYTKGGYTNFKVTQVIEIQVTENSEFEDTFEHDIKKEIIDYEQDPRWRGYTADEFIEARIRDYNETSGGEVVVRIHSERDIITIKADDKAAERVSVEQTFRDSGIDEGRGDNQGKSNGGLQFSRSFDSVGRQLTEQQESYFKDSKVRDEDGNLLRVYHGTVREFYEFDREYANKLPGFKAAIVIDHNQYGVIEF